MAHSSFAKARQGRGVMIEPADQVLNIYSEETDKPAPSTQNENEEDSSKSKPSPRYAPYKQGNNSNPGRSGGNNYRGGSSNNGGKSHRGRNPNNRGNSNRGGFNHGGNYRDKKK